MQSKGRVLHIAFDAFGTLFKPKRPIAVQYGEVANRLGIQGFTTDELNQSFKEAFKKQSSNHPNYGRATDMTPSQWWAEIIKTTFTPYLNPSQELPSTLVPNLLDRFGSAEGYVLFDDVKPFFKHLKQLSASDATTKLHQMADWPYEHTIVSVISNSDDHVFPILNSLGITTGNGSADRDNLDHDIPIVTLSYDVRVEKPDKRIFDAAESRVRGLLDKAGIHTHQLSQIMVGDDFAKDYLAATSAGWRALHVDREDHFGDIFAQASTPIARIPRNRLLLAFPRLRDKALPDEVHAIQDLRAVLDPSIYKSCR